MMLTEVKQISQREALSRTSPEYKAFIRSEPIDMRVFFDDFKCDVGRESRLATTQRTASWSFI